MLGDETAARLGARLVIVLIGERPGLSSPDSLGAYLTYAPRPGLTDADRNCVSNIRTGGLDIEAAASKITWLVTKALAAEMSGVRLKDDSDKGGLASFSARRFGLLNNPNEQIIIGHDEILTRASGVSPRARRVLSQERQKTFPSRLPDWTSGARASGRW